MAEEERERIELLKDGRITIPKKWRDLLGLKHGSILEAKLTETKQIILEVLAR